MKKSDLDTIPTSARDKIVSFLQHKVQESNSIAKSSAELYVINCEEKHRSQALIAQGEHNAYSVLLKLFE